MDGGTGRLSEVLEGTLLLEGTVHVVNWKAWNGTDAVDGRDGDRKGHWIRTLLLEGMSSTGRLGTERTLLMEGTSDSDVVAGRDVVNWKAWNGTDVVDGRDVGFGRCCWKGR